MRKHPGRRNDEFHVGNHTSGIHLHPDGPALDLATEAMHAGDLSRARMVLEPLIGPEHDAVARNNLATICLLEGDPIAAHALLAPNLSGRRGPQPYAHALAARCLAATGRDLERARRHVLQAVDDLVTGLDAVDRISRVPDAAWREYTVAILLAAGAIQDDGLAWDLYVRLNQVHNHPEAHYLGGVAAFNRRRWASAGRAWSHIQDDSWTAVTAFKSLLPLLESGVAPPHRLPYEVPDFSTWLRPGPDSDVLRFVQLSGRHSKDLSAQELEFAEGTAADPLRWTLLLAWALTDVIDTPAKAKAQLVTVIVQFGGTRGEALARSMFQANSISLEMKTAAALGLLHDGRIESGAEIAMLVDGREHRIRISRAALVSSGDGEMDQRYREAIAARDRGDKQLARSILEPMADPEGTMHAPSTMAYANLLREEGQFGRARQLLNLLAMAHPDEPAVLFNLAALDLQVQDPAGARAYVKRALALTELDEGMRLKLKNLSQHVDSLDKTLTAIGRFPSDVMAERFAERPTRVDAGLTQALQLLPVHWLDAACALHGLDHPAGGRKDRERALRDHLLADPAAALRRALDTDPGGRLPALLKTLLAHGGWAPREDVVHLFGSDTRDQVGRSGSRAYTPLGHARLSCLVFVGSARASDLPEVIVGVPLELREACWGVAIAADALRAQDE